MESSRHASVATRDRPAWAQCRRSLRAADLEKRRWSCVGERSGVPRGTPGSEIRHLAFHVEHRPLPPRTHERRRRLASVDQCQDVVAYAQTHARPSLPGGPRTGAPLQAVSGASAGASVVMRCPTQLEAQASCRQPATVRLTGRWRGSRLNPQRRNCCRVALPWRRSVGYRPSTAASAAQAEQGGPLAPWPHSRAGGWLAAAGCRGAGCHGLWRSRSLLEADMGAPRRSQRPQSRRLPVPSTSVRWRRTRSRVRPDDAALGGPFRASLVAASAPRPCLPLRASEGAASRKRCGRIHPSRFAARRTGPCCGGTPGPRRPIGLGAGCQRPVRSS